MLGDAGVLWAGKVRRRLHHLTAGVIETWGDKVKKGKGEADVLAREDRWFERGGKEAIFVKSEKPCERGDG